MKKLWLVVAVIAFVAVFISVPVAAAEAGTCTTIADGVLKDKMGNLLVMGFDEFGYNYQAHLFKGVDDGFDRVLGNDSSDYADDLLVMKWSDAWLSNMDCNDDGKLDRGTNGISEGWVTNMYNGDYDSDNNGTQDAHYTWFTKMVWVGPGGTWFGQYEIIQDVGNDPVGGFHGLQEKVQSPGLGLNDQWTSIP